MRQVDGRHKEEDGRIWSNGVKEGTGAWDEGKVEGEATREGVRGVSGRTE